MMSHRSLNQVKELHDAVKRHLDARDDLKRAQSLVARYDNDADAAKMVDSAILRLERIEITMRKLVGYPPPQTPGMRFVPAEERQELYDREATT